MFGADNSEQLYHLFLFGGLGLLLAVYYDAFRTWRVLFHSGKLAVALQDIVFFLSSALAFFLLSLAVTGGVLRWFLFLGVVLGFVAYRMTVGLFSVRLLRWIFQTISRLFEGIGRAVRAVLRILWIPFRLPCRVLRRIFKKFAQKIPIFSKKVLKSVLSVLYNIKGLFISSSVDAAKGDSDAYEKR